MSQKYPDPVDGYDFIIGRGGKPTYRFNKKMTAAEKVPENVKAQLLEQYEMLSAERAEENRRAEAEEAAKAATELLQPPVVAVDVLDEVGFVGEEIADVKVPESVVTHSMPAQPNPFYEPSQLEEMSIEEKAILDAYPTDPSVQPGEIPAALDTLAMEQELERRKDIIEELMKGSVYEASLEELAGQLAERFNIYTVFIGREPLHTDIHPITAEVMNNFDRGLAYKQYVRATLSGTLKDVGNTIHVAQEDARFERPIPAQVQPLPPQTRVLEEHSHLNSQVKNAETYGIDGIIQDPPIFNRRPIVDESWLSKAKSIDDFDLETL